MSADLFAAFEDPSKPPPPSQQTTTSDTSFASASFPLASSSTSTLPTQKPVQQWSRHLNASNQIPQSWGGPQLSPAFNTQPAPVVTGSVANIQPVNKEESDDSDDDGDEDGWGDFEVALDTDSSFAPHRKLPATPKPAINTQSTLGGFASQRPAQVVRVSTLDLVSNNLVGFHGPPPKSDQPQHLSALSMNSSPKQSEVRPRTKTNIDPNVLFDADDFEEGQDGVESDDDFGEFETVATPVQPQMDLLSGVQPVHSSPMNAAKKASELLLDLSLSDPAPVPAQPPQANVTKVSASVRKQEPRRPNPHQEATRPPIHATSQITGSNWDLFSNSPKQSSVSPSKTVDTTWDWDSPEPPTTIRPTNSAKRISTSTQPSTEITTTDESASWDWDPVDATSETVAETEDSALPPINIPPPSILLSAFPQLFDQANENLYRPISGQSQSVKDRILSDTKVHEFLSGYLSLAVVAARIIAGRRMRWHRDKFLSQSMSISAAGSKGMKLAGVDKTRTAREDREAADIVSSWKSQVGRLRSTVASVNSAAKMKGGKQLKIPDIADTMQVVTAKDVPVAPDACVICGLKRNERVAKIDYEVEDSFGEWWADHWGHVACKRFWLQHENTLRQR